MNIFSKKIALIFALIVIIELLSFGAYFFEPLRLVSAIIISLLILILTLRNLESGLLILFVELIIDSKGHLFELGPLSIRMLIFGAIMLAYLIKLRHKDERLKIITYLKEFRPLKYLVALGFFCILALATALFYKNSLSNIFYDFNSWLFFLIIFPVLATYFKAKHEVYQRLKETIIAAFLFLSFETLFILYIFTHNISLMSDLYFWLRISGVAEITATLTSWPRIFLQSQIYAAIFLVSLPFILKIKNLNTWLLMILSWSVIILSMSRSFWLAIAVVLLLALIFLFFLFPWKTVVLKISLIISSAVLAIIFILIIVLFPVPKPGVFSADSFIKRISLDSGESAVASRWSLLPVMWQEITKQPILGSGFGKTITYKSSDPRILQNNPNGDYTTYAFEWGYLALCLKFGLLGLISYLALLAFGIYQGLLKWKNGNNLAGVLALGLVLISLINIFTPYLDHPLGIAYILLALILIEQKNITLL